MCLADVFLFKNIDDFSVCNSYDDILQLLPCIFDQVRDPFEWDFDEIFFNGIRDEWIIRCITR